MSDNKKQEISGKAPVNKSNNQSAQKNGNKTLYIVIGLVAVLIIGFLTVKAIPGGDGATQTSSTEDIKITKSDITETAKFYPYTAGGNKGEVLAVKATDGTIRTALNTCQICFDSGRGYYVQEGNELVCQNCLNRFNIDQIEKEKDGCNPVPVLSENKTDDGTTITITNEFLTLNKVLFGNWKK